MNFLQYLATAAALAAPLLLGVAATPASGEEPKTPQAATKPADAAPAVMATVNGTPILRVDVERAVKALLSSRGQQPLPPELKKQAEDAALDQLISAELLYQAGSKVTIADLEKKVADKVNQNKAKLGTAEAFAAALKSADLTEKELADLTRKDIVITSFIEQEIVSKSTATEADAKKFYDDNLDKFKKPESVNASHILCDITPQAKAEDKQKAREKAAALMKRIKAGEDFAAVAKAESGCPSSKQGGDLGEFGRGQMVKPFEDAAFSLKPGEVSDIVETQFGYHIIKLTKKQEAQLVSYDDVKLKIVDYLKGLKTQQGVNDYISKLREKAKIEKSGK